MCADVFFSTCFLILLFSLPTIFEHLLRLRFELEQKYQIFSSVLVLFICWTANEICICEWKVFHGARSSFPLFLCVCVFVYEEGVSLRMHFVIFEIVWLIELCPVVRTPPVYLGDFTYFIFSLMHDWNFFVGNWRFCVFIPHEDK